MKVRITQCPDNSYWYRKQIGAEIFVMEHETIKQHYVLEGSSQIIRKEDCEPVENPEQKEEVELIPFSIEKFNEGLKPVYRDGSCPIDVFISGEHYPVFSTKSYGVCCHHTNGILISSRYAESPLDLFLEQPVKKIHLWLDVARTKGGDYIVPAFYLAKDRSSAIERRAGSIDYVGDPIKLEIKL